MIKASYSQGSISSLSQEAFTLFERSSFGEKLDNKVVYASVEALFLLSENKLELISKGKKLDFESLLNNLKSKDKKIDIKFRVFQNLRKKGYIVKTALKFGAEFRVYDKGIKPGHDHAKWIVFTSKENSSLKWHDFASINRVAHSTKKKLLMAVVDEEGDVSFYEVSWLKP